MRLNMIVTIDVFEAFRQAIAIDQANRAAKPNPLAYMDDDRSRHNEIVRASFASCGFAVGGS
jgi:hypothetical protein